MLIRIDKHFHSTASCYSMYSDLLFIQSKWIFYSDEGRGGKTLKSSSWVRAQGVPGPGVQFELHVEKGNKREPH